MLAKVAGAQGDLEKQLAELRHALSDPAAGAALAQSVTQLRTLAGLQQRINGADLQGLAAIRAEVTASVAATQAVVQQAQTATGAAQITQATLHLASEEARSSVNGFMDDYYKRRIFDPYLKFASAKDEEEYRSREAERQQQIEKAMAAHTPEGDLRAANLSLDQLHDAGAHGADKSPDYARWDKSLTEKRDSLASGIDAMNAGTGTAKSPTPDPLSQVKPDANVSPDVLASLRSAGVTMPEQDSPGYPATLGGAPAGKLGRGKAT